MQTSQLLSEDKDKKRRSQLNPKPHTIFAMNEVVYQGTGHNIKELLLGGVSAEDLLK
jgi:hypothetical protein